MNMKILFLITQSEMGGAQRYVLDLAQGLSETGADIAVVSARNAWFQNRLAAAGVPFREIKNAQRNIHMLMEIKLFFELVKIIRKEHPDVLHLNSSKIGAMGALVAKLLRVPKVVFTAHGWVFNEQLPWWQKRLYVFISWFAAFFQDAIICVSEHDKKTALKHAIAPEHKLTVIHNGIDLKHALFLDKKEARERLGIADDAVVVGTIANFYKTKSLETLVLPAISATHISPKIIFVIIGDGPEKEKVAGLIAKYKLEKHFILPGMLENASAYMKAFDVFALPSKKEGLPYALLEAMAAKVPCVASDVGGIPEILKNGQNGMVIPHITPTKLWDAITQLLKNKKLARELISAASAAVASDFSFKKMLKETLAVYTKEL